MGDFILQEDDPTVFTDKVSPVGTVFPPGLTEVNVVQAVNLNTLKSAVLDARQAIRGAEINCKHFFLQFGAVEGGVVDCAAAIQAAVDFATYNTGEEGSPARISTYLPGGVYKTTDTIHLGYGSSFVSAFLRGDAYRYKGEPFSGTAIVPTFSDRPAINFQGGRGSSVQDIAVIGLLNDWIEDQNYARTGEAALADDTVAANWNDPSLHANQDSRYAPYAAITVDAYAGVRPGTSYPDVTYPAFLGAVAQYNKGISSDILIENVYISGFNVGIAIQPCDQDANADFTTIRRINMERCKWGISIGNSQSRNVAIENVKMGTSFCGVTNNQHGRQVGTFNGPITNLSFGGIKVFEFGSTAFAGPITFDHLYCESTWKLGDAASVSSVDTSLRFESCKLQFHLQDTTRGIPTLLMGGVVTGQAVGVKFLGCFFGNYFSVCSFGHVAEFEDCVFTGSERYVGNAVTFENERFAENFLCGGVVLPRLSHWGKRHTIKHTPVNIATGSRTTVTWTYDGYQAGARTGCIPLYVRTARALGDNFNDDQLNPQFQGFQVDKAGLSSCTLSNRTLTLVFSSLSDAAAMRNGLMPGDVLWDESTGSVFFIRSRSGTTVVADLQNNFKDAGGGTFATIDTINLATGYFYAGNARFYTPTYPLLGTVTNGNNTISNVQRDDGFSGVIESNIEVGDHLWVDELKDQPYGLSGANITARSNASATITMGTTGRFTQSRRRLNFFIRTGATNR